MKKVILLLVLSFAACLCSKAQVTQTINPEEYTTTTTSVVEITLIRHVTNPYGIATVWVICPAGNVGTIKVNGVSQDMTKAITVGTDKMIPVPVFGSFYVQATEIGDKLWYGYF